MTTRLRRSRVNQRIAGVAGGLAEYFDVDPTLMRLVFVLLAFWHGLGVLAYLILWLLVPRTERLGTDPGGTAYETPSSATEVSTVSEARSPADRQVLAGLLLVLIGVVILVENLRLLAWLSLGNLWPLVLIGLGVFLLYEQRRGR